MPVSISKSGQVSVKKYKKAKTKKAVGDTRKKTLKESKLTKSHKKQAINKKK